MDGREEEELKVTGMDMEENKGKEVRRGKIKEGFERQDKEFVQVLKAHWESVHGGM